MTLRNHIDAVTTDRGTQGLVVGEAKDAVTHIVTQHGGYVGRLLARFGVADPDLPDAKQEVFLVVWRRFGDFEHRSSITTWLYTICRRVAKDLRRRAYRHHERGSAMQRHPITAADQERIAEARERLASLDGACDELGDDKRQALIAYALEDRSVAEIAVLQRCPEKTVFSRLYAARAHLKRALDGVAMWFPWGHAASQSTPAVRETSLSSARVAIGALCVAVAALVLRHVESPRPAILAWTEPNVSARMVPYVDLASAVARVDPVRSPVRAPATPLPILHEPSTMEFSVLDVQTPGAAMAMQQVGFLEFEPRILDAGLVSAGFVTPQAAWYGNARVVAVKPKLLR